MRNLIRKFAAGLAFAGIVTAVGVAVAQQPQFGTRNPAPRLFPTQQVHYLRFTVNFNDCVLVSSLCTVKRGAVPYNAWITRIQQEILTSFNSGTSDFIAIGTKNPVCVSASPLAANSCGATGGLLMQPVSVSGAAGGATTATVLAISAGINATGAGDAPTGANGGFDIFTEYNGAGTASTAGVVVFVIEYIAPNDGSCITPAIGATPTGAAAVC